MGAFLQAGESMPDSKQQAQTLQAEESSMFQEPAERRSGSQGCASDLSGPLSWPLRLPSCLGALPRSV